MDGWQSRMPKNGLQDQTVENGIRAVLSPLNKARASLTGRFAPSMVQVFSPVKGYTLH